ncbi:MAG TPA: hypothetical protein VJA47_03615 [archaeon]|nr:hypothetical protein [archaeon]
MNQNFPQRISRRYDVSLVSENDRDAVGEFLIIDSEKQSEYRVCLVDNDCRDLKVLLTHGSEARFDDHVDYIVAAHGHKALEAARS